MMMHVMFMDMNMDKRFDHDRHVVHEIVRVDVPLVSGPSHIAPGVAAAMDVYRSARRNDGLHLVARRGARPQIEIRSCVGDSGVG